MAPGEGLPRVTLPPLASPVRELWHVLLTLADDAPVSWTLVGGQMVLLHALEHGEVPPVISQDGDMVADVRAQPGALSVLVQTLVDAGFVLSGISADGIAHRYERAIEDQPRAVVIDILAPDGLGERADLTTTPPGRTIEMPGGTQAINRTELCLVEHEDRQAHIPRPTLLAALIGKAAACGLGGDTSRHHRDLALLCSLVEDPFALAEQLTRGDRRQLRKAHALEDTAHTAWLLVPGRIRRNGQDAWAFLTDR